MNTFDNTDIPGREPSQEQEPDRLVNWDQAEQENKTMPMFRPAPMELSGNAPEQPQPAAPVVPPVTPPVMPPVMPPVAPRPVQPRKESPFANSPYVMQHQQPRNAQYLPPQPPMTQQIPAQPQLPADREVPAEKPERKSGGRFWKKAVALLLVFAMVVGGCLATAAIVNNSWEEKSRLLSQDFEQKLQQMDQQIRDLQQQVEENASKPGASTVPGSPVASGETMTPSQVYRQNVDAVVMVSCTVLYSSYGQTTTGTSTGSGFIISEDGYVVTNYHVVENASSVVITTTGGDTHSANIVGYDDTNDVALLKVDGKGLPYVAIGSSAALSVGDQVVAIGNPLGELTSTMTVGYVSGKERSVTTDGITINMIQTDAAINSGNSGGPLFNMKGEVIGITTAKYSGASSSGATIEGIGFAIPMDDAMKIVNELMEHGYIKTAYMGVVVAEMTEEYKSMAKFYNLPVGLYVQSVEPGGPAEKAGILPEDILISFAGQAVDSINDLTKAIRKFQPGDTTKLVVYRAGTEIELTITLTEKPHTVPSTQDAPVQPGTDMPTDGSYEDWYNYFFPFFGTDPND